MSRRQTLMGRALWFARHLGLDDDERHELAMMLPGRSDPASWALLSDGEVAILCSWLRGALLVAELQSLRGNPAVTVDSN